MTSDATGRMSPALQRSLDSTVLFLVTLHVVLRMTMGGESTSDGVNVFIHLLVWIAALVWLMSQALSDRLTLHLTGLELPLILFAVVSLLSFLNALYKYPALLQCLTFATHVLLFLLVVHLRSTAGSRTLLTVFCSTVFVVAVYGVLQRLFLLDMTRMSYEKNPYQIGIGEESHEEWIYRLGGNEVTGTFWSSNTMAGFLVLCLPFVFGLIMDRWRRKSGEGKGDMFLYPALILICGLLVLFWTGSLGGWVSAIAAALFFWAAAPAGRSQTWNKALRIGLVLLAIATAVFIVGVIRRNGMLMQASESLEVRSTYWSAAAGIIRDHPVWGVGLGNYEDRYLKYRPEEPDESKLAHNDYLHLWAEMGIFGLILFCLIMVFLLRKYFRFHAGPREPFVLEKPRIPAGVIAAGGLAFVLAYLLDGRFNDLDQTILLAVILAVLWCVYLVVTYRDDHAFWSGTTTFTRIGLAAGIIGFLIHMVVDFDFMVAGTAAGLFLASAFLLLFLGAPAVREVKVRPVWAWVGVVVLLIIVLPLLLSLLPNLLESENLVASAGRAVKAGDRTAAEQLYSSAVQKNPINAALHAAIAEFYFGWYQAVKKTASHEEVTRLLEQGLTASRTMLRLRESYAPYCFMAASLHYEAWKFYILQRPRPGTPEYARAHSEFLPRAQELMRDAVTLYPSNVRFRYEFGKMLEAMRDVKAATEEYREAWRLHLKYKAKQDKVKRRIPKRFLLTPEAEEELKKKPEVIRGF